MQTFLSYSSGMEDGKKLGINHRNFTRVNDICNLRSESVAQCLKTHITQSQLKGSYQGESQVTKIYIQNINLQPKLLILKS